MSETKGESTMIHPLNMDQTFFEITTKKGETRRVSLRRYRILPNSIWKDYVGKIVRLISLRPNSMPGEHTGNMASVALDFLIVSGFDECSTMGIYFEDIEPYI